jgi:hypothetical protein
LRTSCWRAPTLPAPWHAQGHRNADGVLFVPYGQIDAADAAACDARLAADPAWLSRALDEDRCPRMASCWSTPRYPSPQAEQAIRRADLTLVVVPPEPAACASVAAHRRVARAGGGERIVVNRLNPARDMQHRCDRDAARRGRAVSGARTTPIRIDAAVPKRSRAAAGSSTDAPHSQASHDLNGVANWVDAWLATAATATTSAAGRAGASR